MSEQTKTTMIKTISELKDLIDGIPSNKHVYLVDNNLNFKFVGQVIEYGDIVKIYIEDFPKKQE